MDREANPRAEDGMKDKQADGLLGNENLSGWEGSAEVEPSEDKVISIVQIIMAGFLLLLVSLLPALIFGGYLSSLIIVCLLATSVLVYVDVLRPNQLIQKIKDALNRGQGLPATLFELSRIRFPEFFLAKNNIFSVDIPALITPFSLLVFGLALRFQKNDLTTGPILFSGALAVAAGAAAHKVLQIFLRSAKARLEFVKNKKPMRLFLFLENINKDPLIGDLDGTDCREIVGLLQKGYPEDVFFDERLKIKAMRMLGKIRTAEALAAVRKAFFSEARKISREAYDVLHEASSLPEADLQLLNFLIAKGEWDLLKKIGRWSAEQLVLAYEQSDKKNQDRIVSLLSISEENQLLDLVAEENGKLQEPALAVVLKKWSQPSEIKKIGERLALQGRESAAEKLVLRAFERASDKSSLATITAGFYLEEKRDFFKAAEWFAKSVELDPRGDPWGALLTLGTVFGCFPELREQAEKLKDAACDVRGAAVGLSEEHTQKIRALASAVEENRAVDFLLGLWDSSLANQVKRFRKDSERLPGPFPEGSLACSKCGDSRVDMEYPGSHTRCPECGTVLCKVCYNRLSYTCPKCHVHEEAEYIHK